MIRIEVRGGVPYIDRSSLPPGVTVQVTDYDVDPQSEQRDESGEACARYVVTQ